VVTFTFFAGPFTAAFFIALCSDYFPPLGDGSFDNPQAGCQGKIFNLFAGPLITLMAGIIAF
jgi:hypothetical protein